MVRHFGMVALLLAASLQPLSADEFEEVVGDALDAYREGDVTVAREELNYALGLLNQMKAEELAGHLPEPLEGWEREIEDAASGGMAMSMLGGGTAATAHYRRGDEDFTLSLMADSPMVSGMAAMFSGMASAGGRSARIQRQQFTIAEGDVQGVVGGKVLVQATGNAPVEAMQAHIEAMDLGALEDY